MNQYDIIVSDLSLNSTIDLVSKLYNLPYAEKYVFDFKAAHNFEPTSLLYLSSEIRSCRDRWSSSAFSVTNYKTCRYAAHMGFFQAFGADFGNFPGQAQGSSFYIPISIFNAKEIRLNAAERMQPVGEYIEILMKNLTEILIPDKSSNTYGVLAYSLREIFRNVIEHSETDTFGFCAQYWPTKNKASLAILDRGIGIKASLEANPHLNLHNHIDAIRQSMLPGISGKMYEGIRSDPYNDWQNSGYGLFMTSEICKSGGSFLVASGNAGLKLDHSKEQEFDLYIDGTLINLTIDTTQLAKIEDMLMEISMKGNVKKSSLKPSKASTKFLTDK